MTSSILYTLKGTKIFSKNRLEAYNQLHKNMKNSLLFFDEVIFEGGSHSVSYGDTGSSQFSGSYMGKKDYMTLRTSYSIDSEEKKPYLMTATPQGSDESFPVISTDAYSFYCSFEGEIDLLRENYSGKELDFIKLVQIDYSRFNQIVRENEDFIRAQMPIAEYPWFIEPVLEQWSFPRMACGISLSETLSAIMLSQGSAGQLLLDPFHNDILNYSINYFREKINGNKTQETLSKVIPFMVSDYSSLSLDKIVELRNESSIVEFRNVINQISEKINETDDIDSYVAGLWTRELLDDINEHAPQSVTRYILSTFIDLAVSIPAIPVPEIASIQLLAALAKLIYDKMEESKAMNQYDTSLSHFCSELRDS